MLIALALIFFAPLLVGVLTGNGRAYLQLTIMSLIVWPLWPVMALAAIEELRWR